MVSVNGDTICWPFCLKDAAASFWKVYQRQRKYNASVCLLRAVDVAWQEINEMLIMIDHQNAASLLSYFAALVFSNVPCGFASNVEVFLRTYISSRGSTFPFRRNTVVTSQQRRNRQNQLALALFWRQVYDLGWFEFFGDTLHKIYYEGIRAYVLDLCITTYDESTFAKISLWKRDILLPWLQGSICTPFTTDHQVITTLSGSASRVVDALYVDIRIGEMYEIITEFPDSSFAVFELREALMRTQRHRQLASSVRRTLQRRLLHPGANTSQIIDVYIATVKVFQIIDPQNVFLDIAAAPVCAYLKKRKDTVRCIVASLTDESSGDLYEELYHTDAPPLENCTDSENEKNGTGTFWIPHAYGTAESCSKILSSTGRGGVLPMLVSIYGSKEIFVNEYRLILSNKSAIIFLCVCN